MDLRARLAACGLLVFTSVQDPGPVTSKEFDELHAPLFRREKWQSVPWRTELLEARATALKEKKPLFIWTMDGQTLGCV